MPDDVRDAEDHWRLIDIEQKIDATNAILAQVSLRVNEVIRLLDEINGRLLDDEE